MKLDIDGRHWRDRADEARNVADTMASASARSAMMDVAEGYERLARQAEVRARCAEALADRSCVNLPHLNALT